MSSRHVLLLSLAALLLMSPGTPAAGQGNAPARPALQVRPTDDFEVTGAGDNAAWRKAEWTPLNRRQPEGLRTIRDSRCSTRRPDSISSSRGPTVNSPPP